MGQFVEDLHYRIKTSSGSFLLFSFKLLIGLALGLTFALIGQQIANYGDFSFTLVVVATTMLFARLSKNWRFWGVLSFALICVLLGISLRMYIVVAPGA